VAHLWQKINGRWLFCHSWQDHEWRMITAMTILLLILLVAAFVGLTDWARHDGFAGPRRPEPFR
jgi:hypothetical protein